jgi:transposase
VVEHYTHEAHAELDMSEVRRIGVDETSSKPGHQYVTLFADMDHRRVLFVEEGKDASTFESFARELWEHNGDRHQVEAVCMDMSPAFQAGARKEFPQASMVFDRFHVMKLIQEALDTIRRQEVAQNDLLKQTRYLWLKNPDNLTPSQHQKLKVLEQMNLATSRAYQMKLNLQEMWTLPDRHTAGLHLEQWYQWVIASDIGQPMKKAAHTIKAHATGILSYFPDKLTSGLMEGINSLVQAAKSKARGYRNPRYLKTIIYLLAGRLNFHLPT